METSNPASRTAAKIKETVSKAMAKGADEAVEHREGPVARAIEYQTARLPSDIFLWSAIGAIGGSAFLMFQGRRQLANFVGQWVPTLLILGLYNKVVKVAGSDRLEQDRPIFDEERGSVH